MSPARVARLNPVASLGSALLLDLVLLASIDPVTAAAAVALELVLLPLAGLPPVLLLRRAAPVVLAGALTGLTVTLYGAQSGRVHLRFLLAAVSDGSLALGAAAGLRILAVALPAVVLLTGLDATRLADTLGQRLRLPAAFVLAALAAVRLVGSLREDRRTILLARRTRGVGDGDLIARAWETSFGLLVLAVRRATVLATAMEARGLGAPGPRTWARPATFSRGDLAVLCCGAVVAAGSLATGILAGTYRLLFT